MDEPNQALQADGILNHILALSWNISTEPKLYRELATNPYSPKSLQIISKRFPNERTEEVIHAVVLAEPEGRYDRDFKQLPKTQQEIQLLKQIDSTKEINNRLDQFCKNYAQELNLLPKAFAYNGLSVVVFETADVTEVEQRFSLNQRRDVKLAIIAFIEQVQRPKDPAQKKALSPKLIIKKLATKLPLQEFSAALSLILLFLLASGIYTGYIEQSQTKEKKQILEVQAQKEIQRLPVRLMIPSINVDAAIEYVAHTPEGAMDVPSNTKDVGWYELGPSPGEIGNAVISGHFDGREGKSGVFNNLNELKTGDKLYIINDQGSTITFVVQESRLYTPGHADEVFLPNGGVHLNLITCDGVWNKDKKSYSKRLVVFADILY